MTWVLVALAASASARAAQSPVFVSLFQQSGDVAVFPELGKFLTYSVRLRLGQDPMVQMAIAQKGPCEGQGPRGALSQGVAYAPPPSIEMPSYTVRGSIDAHQAGAAADAEVLVSYELLKSPGCKVLASHTEKFALSAVLEKFSSIVEKLATDLNGDLRPRIRVELYPVDVKGGGKAGPRAANLLTQYLTLRLTGIEGVDLQTKESTNSKLTAEYGVRPEIVFAANGRTVEGRVEVVTPEKAYPPATRGLQLQSKDGDEFADFALNLATTAAGDFSRIRSVRQSGVDKIPAADTAGLLRAALALLCDPSVQTPSGCSPQPQEALAALDKMRKVDVTMAARELAGRANSLMSNFTEAASAFEEALKFPEASAPEKRLPLLNEAAGAWYALQSYSRAAERYEEYFKLGRTQQTALPAVWARMPEASISWSHAAWLAGDQRRALDILIDARAAIGDRPEFRTEFRNVLDGMQLALLQPAIEKLTASLPANDELLGWGMARVGEFYENGSGVPKDYAIARRWYERGAATGNARAEFDLGYLYENGHGVPQDYGKAREWYEKAAEAGDSWAMNNLGILYERGLSVRMDYTVARQWYERAAAAGDEASMTNLGLLYEFGRGVPQDYKKAREWYEKGAAAGEKDSMNDLGLLFEKGLGVPQDYVAARQWYERGAAAGNNASMANLGLLYEMGRGVEIDYAKARQWYERAADAGSAASMRSLGLIYQNGNGVAQDYKKAREWYEKAAALGLKEAMNDLGLMSENGLGAAADYTAARQWYEKAVALGNEAAMGNLGLLYELGHGVTPDYAKARELYEKAAAAGDAWSMNELGLLYEKGSGVAIDYAAARQWYERSAAAGNAGGMTYLGLLYDNARGVPRDYARARQLYEKAAAMQHAWAMYDLGYLYEVGHGVQKDYGIARQWYEKAAAAGNEASMTALGTFYQYGHGVTRDYSAARRWYEKAAAAGDSWGMTNLAAIYESGLGVPKDYELARKWYEKGAAGGDSLAMRDLGEMYEKGHGGQDYALSRQWYEKAAAAGDGPSMTKLGMFYEKGTGVARDLTAARQWYEKAEAAGDKDARKRVKSLGH